MTPEKKFSQAVELFDGGEYFEAHEVWEELWTDANGARHAFLQGLIQIAAALHHAEKRNFSGTRKLFARALDYLAKGASDSEPVDVSALRDRVLDFEIAIQEILSGKEVALPFFKLPVKV